MRIISFNVNSIRVRLDHLAKVIDTYKPDIVGLQETKVTDEDFPLETINDLGYEVEYYGQKTHYGVALLSKTKAIKVQKGFDTDKPASQRRFISSEYPLAEGNSLTVINGYFPQGENREHPDKFPAKQKFYSDLSKHLQQHHDPEKPLLIIGDMNIAPEDVDVGIGEQNQKRWLREGKCCFLPEERQWLETLMSWGLADTYRHHHPHGEGVYSWFDYRSRGFDDDPKRGLRIDLLLASKALLDKSSTSGIAHEIRGLERPSDHCPVWADFDIKLA